MKKNLLLTGLALLILAGCASTPQQSASPAIEKTTQTPHVTPTQDSKPASGGYLTGDGPQDNTPSHLDSIPNATPQIEQLHPYANRPYTALGKQYTPLTEVKVFKEQGIASWYGKKFHGQATSSGEPYDMYAMTAAHPTLPIPSYARITNLSNQKSIVVRINDRGPFLHNRVIDLSYTAAHKLNILNKGSETVLVESIVLQPTSSTSALKPRTEVSVAPLVPADVPSQNIVPGRIYLQLGAFKKLDGAESTVDKVRPHIKQAELSLNINQEGDLHRVYLGSFPSIDDARNYAKHIEPILGFRPIAHIPD